ncbi:hypothetical protein TRAPUB_7433 [Trametes pubescens]|uniref:Uncharacterized protein n=1 Tax=Trametes pubescens TaxID=154538 RepID=A0A1M2V3D5_TRAPU|nr:hypothetical protein TRAPUB_7433 [Trametes pubescens]
MQYRDIEDLYRLPVVRLPKPLTDAEWPKVMNALQDTLDKARANLNAHIIRFELHMRYEELKLAIRKHCVQLPRTPRMLLNPMPIDFIFTPKCRAALERPLDFSVRRVEDPFEAMVPALLKKWNTDVKKKLTRYLRRNLRRIPAGVDPLNLAIAIFTCSRCTDFSSHVPARARTMRYPEVLCHPCLRLEHGNLPHAEDDLYTRIVTRPNFMDDRYERNEEQKPLPCRCVPFDAGRLKDGPVAVASIERMRRVVSALGLDGARATTDELKACGGWLRCTLCEPGGPEEPVKRVYDWVAAFDHEYVHFCNSIDDDAERDSMWQRVDQPEVLTTIQELEPAARKALLSDRRPYWCCSLCWNYESSIRHIKTHLRDSHKIEDTDRAIRDGTIFRHPWIDPEGGRCVQVLRGDGSAHEEVSEGTAYSSDSGSDSE